MNEKRKLVARNQWYKFLNRAGAVHDKPAGSKVEVDSTHFRRNIRSITSDMIGNNWYTKLLLNELFGAYIIDDVYPTLMGVDVCSLGENKQSTVISFEFSKQSQSIIDEMFARMKEFSPFSATRIDYGFRITVRVPERKIDLLKKKPKPKKPEYIETGKFVIDIKDTPTATLHAHIRKIEKEIQRRKQNEIQSMFADYTREREKLVQMNVAIMNLAKNYGCASEWSERLSTHAL